MLKWHFLRDIISFFFYDLLFSSFFLTNLYTEGNLVTSVKLILGCILRESKLLLPATSWGHWIAIHSAVGYTSEWSKWQKRLGTQLDQDTVNFWFSLKLKKRRLHILNLSTTPLKFEGKWNTPAWFICYSILDFYLALILDHTQDVCIYPWVTEKCSTSFTTFVVDYPAAEHNVLPVVFFNMEFPKTPSFHAFCSSAVWIPSKIWRILDVSDVSKHRAGDLHASSATCILNIHMDTSVVQFVHYRSKIPTLGFTVTVTQRWSFQVQLVQGICFLSHTELQLIFHLKHCKINGSSHCWRDSSNYCCVLCVMPAWLLALHKLLLYNY